MLAGCGESLSGRLLVFDGLRAKQRVVQLRGKRADCAACGQNKQTKQQDVEEEEEEEEEGVCAVAVDGGALERGARECALLLKVSKQARGREAVVLIFVLFVVCRRELFWWMFVLLLTFRSVVSRAARACRCPRWTRRDARSCDREAREGASCLCAEEVKQRKIGKTNVGGLRLF